MAMQIRTATRDDWDAICSIYLEGIATGLATFETAAPDWDGWNEIHLPFGRLVAIDGDEVIGWAALSPVSARPAYSGVAEVSVYVAGKFRGTGVGRFLLENLIAASESFGVWTLQAGIFPENSASIALHNRCGFREVGRRERISKLHSVWQDTVLLERRSSIVGHD
jgi:phosphinothricin acetyltransferase